MNLNVCFVCGGTNVGITYARALKHISCWDCNNKTLSSYYNNDYKNEIIVKLGEFKIEIYNNTVSACMLDDDESEIEVYMLGDLEAAVSKAKELCDKYIRLMVYC